MQPLSTHEPPTELLFTPTESAGERTEHRDSGTQHIRSSTQHRESVGEVDVKGPRMTTAISSATDMPELQGGDNRQQTADSGQEVEAGAGAARVEMEALRETVAAQRREIERLREREVHECCLLFIV
jgi:hypothetical protein